MRIMSLCFTVLAATCFAGCMFRTHVKASPFVPPAELITRSTLKELAESGQAVKVMLRVPKVERELTEQDQVRNTAYNTIEKEFLKAGYTVRDRALLLRVLGATKAVDYATIRDKIDTDVILEIISMQTHDSVTRQYVRVKDGRPGRSPADLSFKFSGWRFEAKVVLVKTGEIGGIYTYFILPSEDYFIMTTGDIRRVRTASPEGEEEAFSHYGFSLDRAAAVFAQGVIEQIRP